MTVIQHLQQNIEDIRMCFFDFIEQNHRVGISSHLLRELAAFLIADVAGRRTDNLRDGVFFHVFTHVNPNESLFRAEHSFRQCLGEFGLTDTGRAEEKEGTNRTVRILQADPSAPDSAGYRTPCLILPDDTLMKHRLQLFQALILLLGQFLDRDSGPE